MPTVPTYPENNGWAGDLNNRQQQRLAQHRSELEALSQQWMNDEISFNEYNKQVKRRDGVSKVRSLSMVRKCSKVLTFSGNPWSGIRETISIL